MFGRPDAVEIGRQAMRRKIVTIFFFLLFLAGAGALMSGCNTVHGVGEDLESGSNAVKKAL
jgi:predicted small secreted protein